MIANEGKAVTSLLELFLRKVAETPDAVAVEAEVQKVVTKQHENALNTLPAAAASAAASDLGSKAMLKITYAELDSRARHIAAVVAVQIAAHEAKASAAVAVAVQDPTSKSAPKLGAAAQKLAAQNAKAKVEEGGITTTAKDMPVAVCGQGLSAVTGVLAAWHL
eukprot:gene28258-1786_t